MNIQVDGHFGIIYMVSILSVSWARAAHIHAWTHTNIIAYYCPRLASAGLGEKLLCSSISCQVNCVCLCTNKKDYNRQTYTTQNFWIYRAVANNLPGTWFVHFLSKNNVLLKSLILPTTNCQLFTVRHFLSGLAAEIAGSRIFVYYLLQIYKVDKVLFS